MGLSLSYFYTDWRRNKEINMGLCQLMLGKHLEPTPSLSLAEMEDFFPIFRDTRSKSKAKIITISGLKATLFTDLVLRKKRRQAKRTAGEWERTLLKLQNSF